MPGGFGFIPRLADQPAGFIMAHRAVKLFPLFEPVRDERLMRHRASQLRG